MNITLKWKVNNLKNVQIITVLICMTKTTMHCIAMVTMLTMLTENLMLMLRDLGEKELRRWATYNHWIALALLMHCPLVICTVANLHCKALTFASWIAVYHCTVSSDKLQSTVYHCNFAVQHSLKHYNHHLHCFNLCCIVLFASYFIALHCIVGSL